MTGKPEIQKQQKTATGSWVHWVNRLVQIYSKVYESSSNTWQSHTKHAWSKHKLQICLQPPSNRYNHVPSQQTMYCYVTIARCSAPSQYACLGCYECYLLLLLGLGSHIIIIVVDDMIIIMLTIFDEGWKVQDIMPRRFVPFESPRTRVPGIVSLDERA